MANPLSKTDWSIDDWKDYWDAGDIAFQTNGYQPELLKHEKLLFPEDGKSYRVLLPLCGKAYDMKWFADKGHSVVGVDCSETAVRGFFEEHSLEYTKKDEGAFKVLRSASPGCDIACYVGDIFDLPQANFEKCNAVWDYGSIIAINPEMHKKYMEAILGKLTQDVNYLLMLFDFDDYQGPPGIAYQISPEMFHDVFGDAFSIKDLPESKRERDLRGRPIAMENYYHLVRK